MSTRRDALLTLAAAGALPVLQGQHQHSEADKPATAPQPPKNFGAEDFKLLGELVDMIIPRTGTPGASDAGVPVFIDRAITRTPALGMNFRNGFTWLKEAGFPSLSAPERIAFLTKASEDGHPFFLLIKNLTVDGYYSSKEGLVSELGYHGNTYLKEFPGCTHPEHQLKKADAD